MNRRGLAGIWWLVIVLVVGLVLVILISMLLDNTRQLPADTNNPECPHHYDTALALPAAVTNIPEYHDCQRLVNLDNETYGALAGVFVREHLDSVVIPEVFVPMRPGIPGGFDPLGNRLNSAIIPTPQQEQQFRANAIAVAEIKSWDPGYGALGVYPGLNCLYVTRVRSSPTTYGYAALMIRVIGPDDAVCLPQGAPQQGGKWLKVWHTSPTPGDSPFPAVARWDWDTQHRKHYVSMLCSTDWCEIGDTDLTPEPARSVTSGTRAQQIPWVHKGLYDEQQLAILKADGKLYPSGVVATASPDPALATYTEASFQEWKPVAQTVLPTDLQVYYKKLNFGVGSIPGITNQVSLCYGPRFFGCIPFFDALQTILMPCWKSEDGRIWWSRIVASGGRTRYRCTTRRTHGMEHVPATARWRWKANDEGLWTRCAAGCCEENAFQ